MMTRRAMWQLVVSFLLPLWVVWRPDVFWTVFFAPGLAALDLMAFLPAQINDRITYGIHPEGGASSAIPLVGLVSIGFWVGLLGLVLAACIYRRRRPAHLSLPR